MRQLVKLALALFVLFTCSILPSVPAQAASSDPAPAKPVTMQVNITVDNPNIFWNYTFLTKDMSLGKPSVVKLSWSVGEVPKGEKSQVVVNAGKDSGQLSITTDKGALVNIETAILDAKGDKVGYIGLQVKNNGQTEKITISPPDYTEPKIVWGNL